MVILFTPHPICSIHKMEKKNQLLELNSYKMFLTSTPLSYMYPQCSKLRFYFVRPSGAFILKLCARDFPCALL